jgi:hypothetical protein
MIVDLFMRRQKDKKKIKIDKTNFKGLIESRKADN